MFQPTPLKTQKNTWYMATCIRDACWIHTHLSSRTSCKWAVHVSHFFNPWGDHISVRGTWTGWRLCGKRSATWLVDWCFWMLFFWLVEVQNQKMKAKHRNTMMRCLWIKTPLPKKHNYPTKTREVPNKNSSFPQKCPVLKCRGYGPVPGKCISWSAIYQPRRVGPWIWQRNTTLLHGSYFRVGKPLCFCFC